MCIVNSARYIRSSDPTPSCVRKKKKLYMHHEMLVRNLAAMCLPLPARESYPMRLNVNLFATIVTNMCGGRLFPKSWRNNA